MINRRNFTNLVAAVGMGACVAVSGMSAAIAQESKEIVYITPSLDVTFWRIMANGVEAAAKEGGYTFSALDSTNSGPRQLQNAQDAIARGVAGIVISPTDSSTAPSVLALAEKAGIPVVISDIGTNSGEFVSFIKSDNYAGAHGVGEALAAALIEKGWQDGTVGIVAISQARQNGQARTSGFRDALKEAGIEGDAGLRQMEKYNAEETFVFVQDMLTANPDMRGLFIQYDAPALGALRAIKAARREGEILVAAFDGIPEFVPLLQSGKLVVSGMQQPWLMGSTSGKALIEHLNGGTPEAEIVVDIISASSSNIAEIEPDIQLTVFGNE
ncbi:MAG: substrate-binding domain-containing protein [Paracoccaceae bacterium]